MSWAILVCAADFAPKKFADDMRQGCDLLVAVDAGLTSILAAGEKPHVILGDFDSLGYVPDAEKATLCVYPSEKDESDLELALRYVRDFHPECSDVVVYGALGGRLDQTLAALQTAAAFAASFSVTLRSPKETVYVLPSGGQLQLSKSSANYVSVFSGVDESRGVEIRGLKYEYAGSLSAQGSLGLSNEFVGKEAIVSVEEGLLFVVEQEE